MKCPSCTGKLTQIIENRFKCFNRECSEFKVMKAVLKDRIVNTKIFKKEKEEEKHPAKRRIK